MATMRMRYRRSGLNWVALLLAGMICGAALAGAIITLRHSPTQAAAPLTAAPPADRLHTDLVGGDQSLQLNEPAIDDSLDTGGRLGGITSADTPNDAALKRPAPLNPTPHWKFLEMNQLPDGPDAATTPAGAPPSQEPVMSPERDR
ncbi:MAG TPA: hypothetical protein VFI42_04960 [Thermomicrobiaceae bacterium]|nr:hypothetical protein [Thermomicrobiaceae bacterium]